MRHVHGAIRRGVAEGLDDVAGRIEQCDAPLVDDGSEPPLREFAVGPAEVNKSSPSDATRAGMRGVASILHLLNGKDLTPVDALPLQGEEWDRNVPSAIRAQ
jgi:hypothetical protein